MTEGLRIAVVLDHGDSLGRWEEAGVFNGQATLLREWQKRDAAISIVSFGRRDELDFAPRLAGMQILCNSLGLPDKFYARRLHQIHAAPLLKCQLVVTYDAPSIVVATRIAWAWQIPLVYRFGYVLSLLHRRTTPSDSDRIEQLEDAERRGIKLAAHIIASTRNIAKDVIEMDAIAQGKISVIPNYVDSDQFRPLQEEKRFDLIFVGRTSVAKNLWSLLDAVERLDVTIAIVGGPLPAERGTEYDQLPKLEARYGDLDGRIHWIGRVEHGDLPRYYNSARAFILCSFSEGSVRALLEAMACGLPIIGTDVPEINNMIEHEASGYLCQTDSDSIASAIQTLLAKPDLMSRLGERARRVALENYSQSQVAQRGYDLLLEVARRNPVASKTKRIAQYLLRRR